MILIKILILIVSNMEEHMSSFIDDYRDVYKECYCKAEGEIKCEQMLTMIANAYDLNKMMPGSKGHDFHACMKNHDFGTR